MVLGFVQELVGLILSVAVECEVTKPFTVTIFTFCKCENRINFCQALNYTIFCFTVYMAEHSKGSLYLFRHTLCKYIPNLSYSDMTRIKASGEDEQLISENLVRLYQHEEFTCSFHIVL